MSDAVLNTISHSTDRFGPFGGRYVPETLIPALDELEAAYDAAMQDATFRADLDSLLARICRTPVRAHVRSALSERIGAPVWLKREDLNHTGAHKINNTVGQALLAVRMGKSASSPKRAPDSTAWPRRPFAHALD